MTRRGLRPATILAWASSSSASDGRGHGQRRDPEAVLGPYPCTKSSSCARRWRPCSASPCCGSKAGSAPFAPGDRVCTSRADSAWWPRTWRSSGRSRRSRSPMRPPCSSSRRSSPASPSRSSVNGWASAAFPPSRSGSSGCWWCSGRAAASSSCPWTNRPWCCRSWRRLPMRSCRSSPGACGRARPPPPWQSTFRAP